MNAHGQGNSIGRNVPAGYMTVTMFADRMGVSPSTVRRWIKIGDIVPERRKYGKLSVALFTQKHVAQMISDGL